jgi:hypothetical protein
MPNQVEPSSHVKPPGFRASASLLARFSVFDLGLTALGYVWVGLLYQHWKPHGAAYRRPGIQMLTAFLLGVGVIAWLMMRAIQRKDFLVMFYGALLACWSLANISADMHKSGLPRSWVIISASAAFASALFAFWNLVLVLRSADELQRKINYQALAFAYSGTLIITLGYSLLEGIVLPHLGHLWVCGLMVVLWSVGLILSSRRYQ